MNAENSVQKVVFYLYIRIQVLLKTDKMCCPIL